MCNWEKIADAYREGYFAGMNYEKGKQLDLYENLYVGKFGDLQCYKCMMYMVDRIEILEVHKAKCDEWSIARGQK